MISRRSLVYVGLNRWDTIWQRSHHLAQNLSQSFRVLYVDPVAYSIPGYLRNYLKGDRSRNLPPRLRSIHPNLTVFTPPPLLPFSLDNKLINYLDHNLLAHMVRRLLSQLDMPQPVLWLTFPVHFPLVGKLGEILVCYDCMDNYPAFYPPGTARARLAVQLEEKLLLSADLVITPALSLQNRLQEVHTNVHLVRNAVSRQFLTYQPGESGSPPADWPGEDGPVLGYMGTIARWLDFEAIIRISTRHPDWRIVFVGPAEIDLTAYRGLTNLHFLGPKSYDRLADYAARFDIGLIPFLMNELTLNVNPVKIYEYFALGKPVVATRLPELMPFSGVCYLTNSTAEFVQQVERAVEDLYLSSSVKQHEAQAQRRAIAQANTWNERTAEVLNILEAHLTSKQII